MQTLDVSPSHTLKRRLLYSVMLVFSQPSSKIPPVTTDFRSVKGITIQDFALEFWSWFFLSRFCEAGKMACLWPSPSLRRAERRARSGEQSSASALACIRQRPCCQRPRVNNPFRLRNFHRAKKMNFSEKCRFEKV